MRLYPSAIALHTYVNGIPFAVFSIHNVRSIVPIQFRAPDADRLEKGGLANPRATTDPHDALL